MILIKIIYLARAIDSALAGGVAMLNSTLERDKLFGCKDRYLGVILYSYESVLALATSASSVSMCCSSRLSLWLMRCSLVVAGSSSRVTSCDCEAPVAAPWPTSAVTAAPVLVGSCDLDGEAPPLLLGSTSTDDLVLHVNVQCSAVPERKYRRYVSPKSKASPALAKRLPLLPSSVSSAAALLPVPVPVLQHRR